MVRSLLALFLSATTLVAGPTREDRVKAVETGLLQPVRIRGVAPWTLQERMRELKVPGLSIAVIHDFQIDWTKGYGLKDVETGEKVTETTIFQAASISKPVAAAVVLRKVGEGALELDADINRVLRSWHVPENEFTREEKVTPRRIMSHTAGLTVGGFPGYSVESDIPTLVQILNGESPANSAPIRVDVVPGTRLRYSGGGITVMQLAITDLTGAAFPELARGLVLDPAGMSSSTYEQPLPPASAALAASGHRRNGKPLKGRWHIYPEMAAAGLWTTSGDLARFAIEIQRSYRGDPGRILSQSMTREMLTHVIEDAGLGFFLQRHGSEIYFEHGGSNEGFRSALVANRDRGYGAAVMVNSDNGQIMSEIIRGIAAAYDWDGYLDDPFEPLALQDQELDLFTGIYLVHEDLAIRITRDGKHLAVTESPLRYDLYPITPKDFVRPDRPSRYVFGGRTGTHPDTLLIKDRTPAMAVRVSLPAAFSTPREKLEAGAIEEAIAGIPDHPGHQPPIDGR